MPDCDWRECELTPWRVRYPAEAIGAEEWVSVFSGEPDHSEMRRWIDVAQDLQSRSRPSHPRVFISHRKEDEVMAHDAAAAARSVGFEYWLDVEDPELAVLTTWASRLDQTTRSAAIASTIEMPLLNCTHVLAVITQRTAGSMWVPYEYGRVKDDDVVHAGAACWTHIDPGTEQFAE